MSDNFLNFLARERARITKQISDLNAELDANLRAERLYQKSLLEGGARIRLETGHYTVTTSSMAGAPITATPSSVVATAGNLESTLKPATVVATGVITSAGVGKATITSSAKAVSASVVESVQIHDETDAIVTWPGTLQDRILRALQFPPATGLTSSGILELLRRNGAPNLPRTSLSPQISRLKRAGAIIKRGKLWFVAPRGDTAATTAASTDSSDQPDGKEDQDE